MAPSPPAVPDPGPDPDSGVARPWHAVSHAENFPVASWLVPARLRPAVVDIYRFARSADDIADEGDADAAQRSARLLELDHALHEAEARGRSAEAIVDALVPHVRAHGLQWQHFHDLLDAFVQDTRTRRHAQVADVDDYCRRSANPVGRLVLELFGAASARNVADSDHICSALQRINFLQDVAPDLQRDRIYIPLSTLAGHGLDEAAFMADVNAGRLGPAARAALRTEALRARRQMLSGCGLVRAVPRRLGWELRAIVAGGLRILDRLDAVDHEVVQRRPALGWRDALPLLGLAATVPVRHPTLRTGA